MILIVSLLRLVGGFGGQHSSARRVPNSRSGANVPAIQRRGRVPREDRPAHGRAVLSAPRTSFDGWSFCARKAV